MDRTAPTRPKGATSMSAIEIRFRRQSETAEDELKAWAVQLEQGDDVKEQLGRLMQPADKERRRDWTLVRGNQREVVGETKLDAIRQVKAMFANLIPAAPMKSDTDPDQTVKQIEARIAELEDEIKAF